MVFIPAFDARAELTHESRVVCVVEGRVLLVDGQWLHSYALMSSSAYSVIYHHHLGHSGTEAYFLVGLQSFNDFEASDSQGSVETISLRGLVSQLSVEEFYVASRALQLSHWLTHNQFCGRCGQPTQPHRFDPCLICTQCEAQYFPQISPCVIGLVWRGSQVLLAHNVRFKEGRYSVLAGFIEAGESVEQALAREVKEEVGVDIHTPMYIGSQSWPFPSQLMLGFFAQFKGGEISVDEYEIDHADWFDIDALPDIPPSETLSGRLIQEFVRSRKRPEVNDVL